MALRWRPQAVPREGPPPHHYQPINASTSCANSRALGGGMGSSAPKSPARTGAVPESRHLTGVANTSLGSAQLRPSGVMAFRTNRIGHRLHKVGVCAGKKHCAGRGRPVPVCFCVGLWDGRVCWGGHWALGRTLLQRGQEALAAGAVQVAVRVQLARELRLVVVHEGIVDDDQQRLLAGERLDDAARARVGNDQRRTCHLLRDPRRVCEPKAAADQAVPRVRRKGGGVGAAAELHVQVGVALPARRGDAVTAGGRGGGACVGGTHSASSSAKGAESTMRTSASKDVVPTVTNTGRAAMLPASLPPRSRRVQAALHNPRPRVPPPLSQQGGWRCRAGVRTAAARPRPPSRALLC